MTGSTAGAPWPGRAGHPYRSHPDSSRDQIGVLVVNARLSEDYRETSGPALRTFWQVNTTTPGSPATPIPSGPQDPLMPLGTFPRTVALPWLITLPASLAALAVVLFIIVPGCTPGLAGSSRIPGCEMNLPVVYLCSFLFLAAAGYSGYRLCRLVASGWC